MKIGQKKGVSLVVVLLLMLVATIAATATFKWLHSEGRSSSSRMLQSEARLSAVAGIETARSWMTYHANETGALIKQYIANSKKPIVLDDILAPFSDGSQEFSVAVVGVNPAGTTYKIKLLSTGRARNGSSHTEAAVLNVDGLYRVKTPTPAATVNFNYNYYGGSTYYDGSGTEMGAIVINGDWNKNPPTTGGDFIVTGNVTLSGNSIDVGGTTCVGGDLDAQNAIDTKNLYVRGRIYGTSLDIDVEEDAYIDSSLAQGNKPISIGGSLTLGAHGSITTNAQANTLTIGQDLCIEAGGQIKKENFTNGREIVVPGNVWIPGHNAFYTGETGTDNYDHIVLGNSAESKVYIADAISSEYYVETLIPEKTFTEDDKKKKVCPESKKISSGDKWRIEVGNGGNNNTYIPGANKNMCGSWGTPAWNNNTGKKAYYVTYTRGWDNWDGDSYSPYDAVTKNAKMYTFYDKSVTDVTFGDYTLDDWLYFSADYSLYRDIKTECSDYCEPDVEIDSNEKKWRYFTPIEDRIAFRFSKAPIGAYYVGGEVFYDLKDHNTYNYSNGKMTGSPFCKQSDDDFRPECGVTPWFKSNATKIETTMASPQPFTCAKHVKDHCDSVWTPTPGAGCDRYDESGNNLGKANYTVNEQLKTGYSSFQLKANKPKCAKNIKKLEDNIENLNTCWYDQYHNDDSLGVNLYNGYLVVEVAYDQTKDLSSQTLRGKFIIIYTNALGQFTLPATASDASVMLYLTHGANGDMLSIPGGVTSNYFIYSLEDINKIKGESKNNVSAVLKGTIYMPQSSCKRVKKFQGAKLELNETMLADMTNAGIICSATKASCAPSSGGGGGGASGSVTETITFGGYDTDYIAVGSQLHIEVESQYKNSESFSADESDPLNPSMVVLPRIVYLTQDPVGKLRDYISPVPLNGAVISGEGQITCPTGSPSPSATMYNGTDTLNTGFWQCTYTDGEYSSQFFVVIPKGVKSEISDVHFYGTSSINLSASEATENLVELVVPKVSSSKADQTFSIQINVTNIGMTGWTLDDEATFANVEENGSSKIYTFSGTTSTSDQRIPLFTVKTTATAETGSMGFILQSPVGCIVGSPSSQYYNITGAATIRRQSLSAYCSLDDTYCNGNIYATAQNYEDCDDIYSGEWVTANGFNCTPTSPNDEWVCASGNSSPITLAQKGAGSPYCTLYIPSTDNSVTGATNGESYDLYASLKKKTYTLTVSTNGASSGSVIVRTKKNSTDDYTVLGTCSESSGCTYNIYAARYVQIEADENEDTFNYWACNSSKCVNNKTIETATSINFIMDASYEYQARFNEQDPHCFYTEFSKTSIFCSNSSETTCVDKCDGKTKCAVGAGKYTSKPDWLMAYSNNGAAFTAPSVYGGYISYNGSNASAMQTVLLNRVIAGMNGRMTARIRTESFNAAKTTNFLNSGFILRSTSDADTYLILSIYGKDDYGAYARICKASGQNTTDASKCIEKQLRTSTGASPSINEMEPIDVTIELNQSTVNVSAKFQTSKMMTNTSFDLGSEWALGSLNDFNHRYVGLKLSDAGFKVSDIGWRAADFPSETCFAYPSISCSFESNYLGGLVPLGESVTPWVGFSSWFNDQNNCIENVEYYYNGCDVASSYFTAMSSDLSAACNSNESGNGLFAITTPEDDLKISSVYKFTYGGVHGFDYADPSNSSIKGIVRNAFVSVECGSTYSSSCGRFTVGALQPCTRNERLVNSPINGSTNEYDVTLTTAVNLRGSTITFNITSLGSGEYIDVVLVDAAGVHSPTRSITNTRKELVVDDMSTASGFNPENVKHVLLKGSDNYVLASAHTSCPNSVSIENCAVAGYAGSEWTLTSTIIHPESAVKCRVVPNTTDISATDYVECSGGNFIVTDETFYNRLNTGSDQELSYDFTIEVYDVDVTQQENSTALPVATCQPSSQSYKHATVDCRIDKYTKAVMGGVPTLTYDVQYCPDYGCKYSVKLDNTIEYANDPAVIPQNGATKTWQPAVNLTDENALTIGDHTYSVSLWNGDSTQKIADCSGDNLTFTVQAATDATGECSVVGSDLRVSITGANHGTTSTEVILAANDVLGNILGYSSIDVDEDKTEIIDLTKKNLTEGATYTFTLSVGDNDYNCGSYTVPWTLSLTCPANVNNHDATADVSVTPTVGHCGGACSWTLTGGSVNESGDDYNGEAITFKDASASGTVTYTFQISRDGASNSPQSCTFDVGYRPDSHISCTWKDNQTHFYLGQQNVSMIFSADNGWIDSDQEMTLTCGSATTSSTCRKGGSCDNLQITMPTTANTYDCTLGNTALGTVCTVRAIVASGVTCSVSSNVVDYGSTFTFTGSAGTTGCNNCFLKVDNTTIVTQNDLTDYEITFNYSTSKEYIYQCTCYNTAQSTQSCSQTVASRIDPPDAECANNPSAVDPGQSVSFTPSKLDNCAIGCDYWIIRSSDSHEMTKKEDHSYNTNSAIPFTGDNSTGSVRYWFKVANTKGRDSCTFDVSYNAPDVECPTTHYTDKEPGQSISFTPSSLTGCSGGCSVTLTRGSTSITPSPSSNYTTNSAVTFTDNAGNDAGKTYATYTFTVNNGAGGTDACTFYVDYDAPDVTCADITKNIEPNTSFGFTPTTLTGCTSGCKYSLDVVGGDNIVPLTSDYDYTGAEINPTGKSGLASSNPHKYRFTVENRAGQTDDCEFSVNYQVPTYGCPYTTGLETATEASVDVTPTDVTNCTQGCNYKVTKGSAGGTNYAINPITDFSYDAPYGSLGSFTGEPTASSTPVTYYVTLSNQAGAGDACSFNVTYKSAESLCKCTDYCSQSQCDNLNKSGGTSASTGVCYFVTAFNIGAWNGTTVNVNGNTFTNTSKTQNDYTAIDGGYYILFSSYIYPSVSMTGGTPVCGGGSGGGGTSGSNVVTITAGYGSDGDKVTVPATTTKIICKDAASGNPQAKKLRMGVSSGTATITLDGHSYDLTNDVNAFSPIDCTDGTELELETTVSVIFLLKDG